MWPNSRRELCSFSGGDHRSYSRDNSGLIPFLVYIKGENLHLDGRNLPVMSRCSMYYYLQKIFCKTADALF